MSISASLLLSAALLLRPDTGLRILNPHGVPAEATLTCNGATRTIVIGGHDFADVADASACTALDSAVPLTAFETGAGGVQRVLGSNATCEASDMYAPLFGCRNGTGTAAVPVVDGATYSWSVEGASLIAGAGTPRITLAFGDAGTVKLTCIITTAQCSRTASAVIGVRAPIEIATFTVPSGTRAGTPVTITWSYGATVPVSQILTGDAFDAPVALTPEQRSFTFTPNHSGARNVELRASYAPSITLEAVRPGKRRAAGRSAASATDCAGASAVRVLELDGCPTVLPFILAPQEVDAGTEFQVSVPLGEGEESRWSVENGTIVVTDDKQGRAVIRAAASGDLFVTARVVKGSCSRETSRTVRVIPAAAQCSVSPVATLTYLSHDCTRARVRARFAGTPPFRGTWSDGEAFVTTQTSIEHDFRSPGTYGITGFRDATCSGVVSGAPHLDSFRLRVTLELEGGSCTTGTLVARFFGTPPFSFYWNAAPDQRWTWVTTNEHVVRRQMQPHEYGEWFIEWASDSACPTLYTETRPVQVGRAFTATVVSVKACRRNTTDSVQIRASVSGPGPYSVTWSDGVVSHSATPSVYRTLPPSSALVEEYTMVDAASGTCRSILENVVSKVVLRPAPRIDVANSDTVLCPGEIGTVSVVEVPAGSTIHWTAYDAEILSGQGTGSITYRSSTRTHGLLKADAVYSDGFCPSSDQAQVNFPASACTAAKAPTP